MKLKFCIPSFDKNYPLNIKVDFNPHTGGGTAVLNGGQTGICNFNLYLRDELKFRLIPPSDRTSWQLEKTDTSVWGSITC